MDNDTFNEGIDVISYTENSLRNYYFKKRYQRYEPDVNTVSVMSSRIRPLLIAVCTSFNNSDCITVVPMLLRAYFDSGNTKIVLKFFENDEMDLPEDVSSDSLPLFIGYDINFNELFRINNKEALDSFDELMQKNIG